jgi:hypothetical protein
MEERLRDSQAEQQRPWRPDQSNSQIHSDRNKNYNASRAQRREDDQELFVDYAFLGKSWLNPNHHCLGI